ncbi:Fringe glycosyltransferase [Camponotus floridanus]|uniref:Fringe glycosyltransferase n=1 Tax=Camponotus floridanus TaxID=104421 RepID=E1ZWM1_CAMFO|nr:Fringe glycosyltransferase [Camponotus floridanus]
MGYIIEYLLKKQLTVVEQFHSHLEPMKFLNKDTFHEQVTKQRVKSSFFKFYPE